MKTILISCMLLFSLAATAQQVSKRFVRKNVASSNLLYWDGAKPMVGTWGTVNQNNILFTKFGSIIAFTTVSDDDEWDAADVKFNPTDAVYHDYTTIPFYRNQTSQQGFISSDMYHADRYLWRGRGDICKLAGLTPAKAKELAKAGKLDRYNSGYRLPTSIELKAMYADENDFPWVIVPAPGRWPKGYGTTAFLPAAGLRDMNGKPSYIGLYGAYWSSSPSSRDYGYGLYFFDSFSYPADHNNVPLGFAVRCVSQ